MNAPSNPYLLTGEFNWDEITKVCWKAAWNFRERAFDLKEKGVAIPFADSVHLFELETFDTNTVHVYGASSDPAGPTQGDELRCLRDMITRCMPNFDEFLLAIANNRGKYEPPNQEFTDIPAARSILYGRLALGGAPSAETLRHISLALGEEPSVLVNKVRILGTEVERSGGSCLKRLEDKLVDMATSAEPRAKRLVGNVPPKPVKGLLGDGGEGPGDNPAALVPRR